MFYIYRKSDGFLLRKVSTQPTKDTLNVDEDFVDEGSSSALNNWVNDGKTYPYYMKNGWVFVDTANFTPKEEQIFHKIKCNDNAKDLHGISPSTESVHEFIDGENGKLSGVDDSLLESTEKYKTDTRLTYKSSIGDYIRKICVEKAYLKLNYPSNNPNYPNTSPDSSNGEGGGLSKYGKSITYTNDPSKYIYNPSNSDNNPLLPLGSATVVNLRENISKFKIILADTTITSGSINNGDYILFTEPPVVEENGNSNVINVTSLIEDRLDEILALNIDVYIDLSRLNCKKFIFPTSNNYNKISIIFSNYAFKKVTILGNNAPSAFNGNTSVEMPIDLWDGEDCGKVNKFYYTTYLDHLLDAFESKTLSFTDDLCYINLKILDLSFLEGIVEGTVGTTTSTYPYTSSQTPDSNSQDSTIRELALLDNLKALKSHIQSNYSGKTVVIQNLDLSACHRMYQQYASAFLPYQFDINYFAEFTGLFVDTVIDETTQSNVKSIDTSGINILRIGITDVNNDGKIYKSNITYPPFIELFYMPNEHPFTYQYLNKSYTYQELANAKLTYGQLNLGKENVGTNGTRRPYRNPSYTPST